MRAYLIIVAFMMLTDLHAGWQDLLNDVVEQRTTSKTVSRGSVQSDALRAALKQGVGFAVSTLGKKNGYFEDSRAKIPLPESFQKMEPLIRKTGGDAMADELILSMNDAATEAAPKTADIFFSAIQKMSIADAQAILKSDENALTEYFRKSSYTALALMIKPIVSKMMEKNKVSYYYKQVRNTYEQNSASISYHDGLLSAGKSFGLGAYVPPKELDEYVTKKAIDGLFVKISEEEKKIRENPLAQKSKLIRDVFGSI